MKMHPLMKLTTTVALFTVATTPQVGATINNAPSPSSLCNLSGVWSAGWPSNYSGSPSTPTPAILRGVSVYPATTPFGIPPAQYMAQNINQALALHPDLKTCLGNGTCKDFQMGVARAINVSAPPCTFLSWPDSETRHSIGSWCKVPWCPANAPPAPPLPPHPRFNVTWPPTYNMQQSTISNPTGNLSGLDQGALLEMDARYGIIVFDGGDMGCLHNRRGPPGDPCKYAQTFTDAEAQARAIKAINNQTRVFSYINMNLMLTRNQFDCPILHEPLFSGFLVTNTSSGQPVHEQPVPQGSRCGDIAPPSAYMDLEAYFLDWTNESAFNWWLDVKLQAFIDSPVIDGFYWDDPKFGNEAPWIRDYLPPDKLAALDKAMADARLEGYMRLSKGGMFCVGSTCPTLLSPPMTCDCQGPPNAPPNCTCDFSAAVVADNLRQTAALNESAGIMYLPFPDSSLDVNISCTGPAAIQDEQTNASLAPMVVQLSCLPGTGNLTVDFASFGLPSVGRNNTQPQCAEFKTNAGCDAGLGVLQRLKALCDGKQSCRFNTSDPVFAHPLTNSSAACGKEKLRLAVRASGCQQGTGGGARAWFRETLAAFLLTRGPHSWMGHNWIGYAQPTWYPEWSLDFGEPTGTLQFTPDGRLAYRDWSKMRVELDVGPPFEARFFPVGVW